MWVLFSTLAFAIIFSISASDDDVLKRKVEFPAGINEALKRAAVAAPRQKRGAIAAAVAPQLAESAGALVKNIGNKLIEGATSVITAGANHVKEAEQRADKNNKEAEKGAAAAKAQAAGYNKATISLVPQKGELGFGDAMTINPPGFSVTSSFSKEKKPPAEEKTSNSFVTYPFGLGMAMMNGCYRTGYQPGDPCYVSASKMKSNLCLNMLDAAAFIGVGFDGRGDYSSEYRKKSLVQRLCAAKGSFGGSQVPDTMNVHGIYDTEVEQTTFSSSGQFQQYLESKAAVSSYKHTFSEAVRKTYGVEAKFSTGGLSVLFGGGPKGSVTTSGSTSNSKSKTSSTQAASYANGQFAKTKRSTFMSMLEVNVIRFEIFMDEVKPTDLSQAFLADYLSLPLSYYSSSSPIKYQNFILRWGTNYVKSAKFGGHLRLTRTKTFKGTASIREFSETANSDTQSLFSNSYSSHSGKFKASASANIFSGAKLSSSYNSDNRFNSNSQSTGQSKSSSSSQSAKAMQTASYGNEYMLVEGGSQKIASILSDFYSPTFKSAFESWLDTIPDYPKPFEFRMGSLTDLLDINVMDMFKKHPNDVKLGCENAKYDDQKRKWYYEASVSNADNSTSKVIRYCENGRSAVEFQKSFNMRRRALKRAIAVYMEEGPIPAYDLNLEGGKPGCETRSLLAVSGKSNALIPKWSDLTNGAYFKMLFDAPEDIPAIALKRDLLYVSFSDHMWYSKKPDGRIHIYSGFKNGGSSDVSRKMVSINGLLMTYDEKTGVFAVTAENFKESNKTLGFLPIWLSGSRVARAEYLHPIEHVQNQQGQGFSVNPCKYRFTNSYKINPSVTNGKCIRFTAASEGDIFVLFASIPRDRDTWYSVQITPEGVAMYKAMQLVAKDRTLEARSLGDKALYQSYFVCVVDKGNAVTIRYGIAREDLAIGDIFMTWTDKVKPLHVQYYGFGSGVKEVTLMDIHMISTKDMGQLNCREKMVDGECVQDCHEQCVGCSVKRSDLGCNACKKYILPLETNVRCVASCPSDRYLEPASKKCLCKLAHVQKPFICISSCPGGTYKDGHFCRIDPCSKKPCLGGTCQRAGSQFTCSCKHGYSGRLCDINKCGQLNCQNGGNCVKSGSVYKCSCRPGFAGNTCQTNINECASNPCQHGKCLDGVNRFTCVCDANYGGTLCNVDMKRCRTTPCKNGGQCINKPNTYTCTCAQHYTGRNCEIDTNKCRFRPCARGSCHNSQNDFTCSCPRGWTGKTCSTNINDCVGVRCQFGGTCVDQVNGWYCRCPQTYTYGKYCNLDNGVYKIKARYGCNSSPRDKYCDAELSWDGRGSEHPHASVEHDDPCTWSIQHVGSNRYIIRNRQGCPSGKYCNHELSWDGRSGKDPVISVENGDRVYWRIVPYAKYWAIRNTQGCNAQDKGTYCGNKWEISYDGRSGTHPIATLENDDPCPWNFVKVG